MLRRTPVGEGGEVVRTWGLAGAPRAERRAAVAAAGLVGTTRSAGGTRVVERTSETVMEQVERILVGRGVKGAVTSGAD